MSGRIVPYHPDYCKATYSDVPCTCGAEKITEVIEAAESVVIAYRRKQANPAEHYRYDKTTRQLEAALRKLEEGRGR